jgi:3-phenylpropionate/trans-cinnamate dioxygenase ferredoxin reductase component
VKRVVIVGAGCAGFTTAFALRDEGFDGSIVLVGAEPVLPYDRTMLSKHPVPSRLGEGWELASIDDYKVRDVGLHLGERVIGVDLHARTVETDAGSSERFDILVLATGASPKRLDVPGSHLDGILFLRDIDDAKVLQEAAEECVGIVGLGLIGCEVASSLASRGLAVTGLCADAAPMATQLGDVVGGLIRRMHEANGVTVRCNDVVAAFEGAENVERIRTASGGAIECTTAVIGVGVRPNTTLAAAIGLHCENGIVVNRECQSSIPTIYAVGDVATQVRPVRRRRTRVEHWENAKAHGHAAALSIVGRPARPTDIPRYWTQQYGQSLHIAGYPELADEIAVTGSLDEKSLSVSYLANGALVGALATNRPRDARRALSLIRDRAKPTARELAAGLRAVLADA